MGKQWLLKKQLIRPWPAWRHTVSVSTLVCGDFGLAASQEASDLWKLPVALYLHMMMMMMMFPCLLNQTPDLLCTSSCCRHTPAKVPRKPNSLQHRMCFLLPVDVTRYDSSNTGCCKILLSHWSLKKKESYFTSSCDFKHNFLKAANPLHILPHTVMNKLRSNVTGVVLKSQLASHWQNPLTTNETKTLCFQTWKTGVRGFSVSTAMSEFYVWRRKTMSAKKPWSSHSSCVA